MRSLTSWPARAAAVWVLFFAVLSSLYAETVVSGAVRGRWRVQDCPFIVIGPTTVNRNDTLIIEPGVVVTFQVGTRLEVLGVLLAQGAERDSIYFISTTRRMGDYERFKFTGFSTFGSILEYCVIQYSRWGLELEEADIVIRRCAISVHTESCLRTSGSSAQISDCSFTNSNGSGVIIQDGGRLSLRYSAIAQCGSNGIAIASGSAPIIDGNYIARNNQHGIFLSSAAACSLSRNLIENCALRGIYVMQSNGVVAFRNIVRQCRTDYAIYWQRSANGAIWNNTIIGNNQTGLALYSSGAEVIGNIIAQNGQDGIYAQEVQATFDYNDVWLNARDNYRGAAAGQNDISQNPALDQDLVPTEGSPVIDAGSRILRDPDGTRSDIGAKFFNQNHPPVITSFSPADFDSAQGDREVQFHVEATDEDGHQLVFRWFVNEDRLGASANFAYTFRRDGHYTVKVEADDRFYMGVTSHTWEFDIYGCGVEEDNRVQPLGFQLQGPYPNPFNNTAWLSLSIPIPAEVRITLWDVQGRLEKALFNSQLAAGCYKYSIDADNLGSGVHLLKVQSKGYSDFRKLVVLE